MELTLSYARPSVATSDESGLKFSMAGESSRSPVSLRAMVGDSLSYARTMLALHQVVTSDLRFKEKDHSAYQVWVQDKYWEEAGPRIQALQEQFEQGKANPDRAKSELQVLLDRKADIESECQPIAKRVAEIESTAWMEPNFRWARWFSYSPILSRYGREALQKLLPCDPVVSVHPDGVIFEVFSFDESSYGRVTVPMDKLDILGDVQYGTTNVDFSLRLAEEFARVRSYRPAWIEVEPAGLTLATSAGQQFEKKIDLPPTWVKGFLQVQSASALPGVQVTLSPGVVADVLLAMHQRREDQGPRSLRFHLAPGQRPRIEIDPWKIVIEEPTCLWQGEEAQEIRIWGRRRLFVLESLLPHAQSVQVKLLGSGMPSYWSVEQDGHSLDIGLSGWTQNDWSRSARFDVMAFSAPVEPARVEEAFAVLEEWRILTSAELAETLGIERPNATALLQQLCREGRAMFDFTRDVYRCRQLLPFAAPQEESDARARHAARLVSEGEVFAERIEPDEAPEFLQRFVAQGVALFEDTIFTEGGSFEPVVGLDSDGRVVFAQCTCGFFRRNKLRQGPCAHILALSAEAAEEILDEYLKEQELEEDAV